jgi:hypothetical protein
VYEFGGFYTDLRLVPRRPFLYELIGTEAAILCAHPPTIDLHAFRLSNAFLGSVAGHPLWMAALRRIVANIRSRRLLSSVELAGVGPLEVQMGLRTLRALRNDGPWDSVATNARGTVLSGLVDFVVVPSRIAWSSDESDEGWMRYTPASYINSDMPHWSVREETESPYLDDEELAALASFGSRQIACDASVAREPRGPKGLPALVGP